MATPLIHIVSWLVVDLEQLRQQLSKPAVTLEIGGFRPPDDLTLSWFGRVTVRSSGESWPTSRGEPMHALCQVNLEQLPWRPGALEDVALLAVFIGPKALSIDGANGENWCLRTYSDLSDLRPMVEMPTQSPIRSFPMRPGAVIDDYPCWEDAFDVVPEVLGDQYYDLFRNVRGFKLGGWPTLIQHGLEWGSAHSPPAPEYVFQIDSSEKANWMWGDNGVGYFGRGVTAEHRDEWTLSWQCY